MSRFHHSVAQMLYIMGGGLLLVLAALLALLQNPEELADMRQRMAVSLRSLDLVTPLDYFWQSRRKAAC